MYADEDAPSSKVTSGAGGGGDVDPALRKAFKLALGGAQDRSDVIEYLATASRMSASSCQAVCRYTTQLDPGPKSVMKDVVVTMGNTAFRLNLMDVPVNKENLLAISPILDTSLHGYIMENPEYTVFDFLQQLWGSIVCVAGLGNANDIKRASQNNEYIQVEGAVKEFFKTRFGKVLLKDANIQCLSHRIKKITVIQAQAMPHADGF